jgi:hypothetical protein
MAERPKMKMVMPEFELLASHALSPALANAPVGIAVNPNIHKKT